MANTVTIEKFTGEGGTGVNKLGDYLEAVADDLAGVTVAQITSADASDLASAVTLVNEIKTALNATYSYSKVLRKATR